jgi:cysteine-rich repeat protein
VCHTAGCGNGIVDSSEECDDGNDHAYDACTNNCNLPRCGDGIRWMDNFATYFEQCDDGNNDDGDGCSSQCMLETCGDSQVDFGEDCDDGPGGVCPDTCRNSECAGGCDVNLCSGNDVCIQAGIECDGSVVSECVGHCLYWNANCPMVWDYPESAGVPLADCVAACKLIPVD